MKKVLIKTLGSVDILLGISLFVVYVTRFYDWGVTEALIGGFPILIAMILTFVGAFYAIKKNNWRWALAGIIIAAAGWAYTFIISLMTVHV